MSPLELAVLGLYFLVLVVLAVFGLHRYLMVYLYYRHAAHKALPAPPPERLPRVTLQLPLYNEMYVAERLLRSVAALRYPRERLDVQVLDDSTDETRWIAAAAVARLRDEGIDAHHIQRALRTGFKAGALDNGLRSARGELVAIFDADFVVPPDFLEQLVGHFADPRVALVQARWGHINREHSLLTRVQSILLDGHFILEHGGRHRSGRFFNFNGTAGVWRKAAIADAGGWQHDTLTEDLDLSYRAQLRGWRFVFVPDLVCLAEVPVEMNAFKGQQRRWAKGSIQTCLKLLPRILVAPLPLAVKVEAAFHLTANFAYPLMVLLSLLMFPAMVIRYDMGLYEMLLVDVPLFLGATASVCSFYAASQREAEPRRWRQRLAHLPAVLATGIGLSVNNASGVLEALAGRGSEFVRTPKHKVEAGSEAWKHKRYRGTAGVAPLLELALAGYFAVMGWYALTHAIWGTLPFVVLFMFGYGYTALLSLLHNLDLPGLREQEA